MSEKNEIQLLEIKVKELSNKFGSHDFSHISRVRSLSARICEAEGGDKFICDIISLIHDLCDHKYFNGNIDTFLFSLLDSCGINDKESIINDIKNFGFSNNSNDLSLNAKIVSDADRLDAIGAIGIARCFSYTGETNRPLYDPDIPLVGLSREDYKKYGSATALNHFYDKLFKIKDSLFTETAKKIACKREEYMKEYVEEFISEWNGLK